MNLPRFSVNNPVTVNLLMWFILLSGGYAWFTLVRAFFPDFESEQIYITVPYPGATPQDVEKGVVLRIEREIRDIDQIEEIESRVLEGAAVIVCKLEPGANRESVLNDLRGEIDKVKPDLPEDAEDPEITEVRPFVPVISIVVHGEVPEEQLREAANDVRDDLLDQPGITEVSIVGQREREIWAEVAPEKLQEHGLTFQEVGSAIAAANLDLPGGQLKGATGNMRVRLLGENRRALPLEDLVIRAEADGGSVRLRDVARVRDTFEDAVKRGHFQGEPALKVLVFKTPEEDALDIAAKVKAYVASHSAIHGGGLHLTATSDLSRFIEQRLDLMVRNAKTGVLLVILALALFLGLRTAFWVTVGIPTAVLGTFTVMLLAGVTINLLSLFGLIIVIGLIVDDALVVGEHVHALQQAGMDPREAAWRGATSMGLPVFASVSTTIAAFLPLMFIQGEMGKFLKELPVVVMAALAMSLLEAFLILPAHLAHDSAHKEPRFAIGRAYRRLSDARDRLITRATAGYGRVLASLLRWRYAVIGAAIGVFLAIVGLLAGDVVPFVLLQEVDAETISVDIEMAAGTPERRTEEVLEQIESLARGFPETDSVFSVLGTSFSDRGQETAADPSTVAQLFIELVAADERESRGMRTSTTIINELRRATADIPGVDKLRMRSENGGPRGADVEVRVRGPDLAVLDRVADRVVSILRDYDGVTELDKDLHTGKLEARFRIRDGARALGLSARDLALQLRGALFGFEAQKLQESRDEVKVRVLLPEVARTSLASLGRLRIALPDGARVPLEEIADLRMERGYASLVRSDGKRAVTVRAEVDEERGNVRAITQDVDRKLDEVRKAHPDVAITFEGRQKETRDSLSSLAVGFPVALLLIYCLVAMVFRSYVQPVLVMTVIPFSLAGAILGHFLMGYPFTLLSLIGSVALAGIVVNDSIVLVDRVNQNRKANLPVFEAVVDGVMNRLRAVLLTSITTVAGLFPLLLERSFQAQFLIPMAISLVFGLVFSTALTLLVLPTFYLVLEDVRTVARWAWYGSAAPRVAPAAEA